ncbi:heterokaryon incompatibility protein-domain-containing protein [Xylaria venustula]|nr:heterokaryon incompatibility protein-domain-containing protein [Xylaria venustula]
MLDADSSWFAACFSFALLSAFLPSILRESHVLIDQVTKLLQLLTLARFTSAKVVEFQDLVTVTRIFGILYVWIDALCIIQDSSEDWEREGATMGDVYANSACTIAATASENPEHGLFRHRDEASILPERIKAPNTGSWPDDAECFLFDRGYLDRRIFNGPLHMRVLHFTKDQIVWECFTETMCETFPEAMPLQMRTKDLGPLRAVRPPTTLLSHPIEKTDWKTLSTWRELVKQYSKCDLTKTTDKLPAFAGLVKTYQDVTGDEYLAGLWRSFLLHQLDWRVYTPGRRISPEHRAPSWSWASVDGPIRPFMLNAGIKTRGPASFGRVLSAYLDLDGYLITASVHSLDDNQTVAQLQIEGELVSGQLFRDTACTTLTLGSQMVCLPLKTEYPVPGISPTQYERVGLLIIIVRERQMEPFNLFGIAFTEDENFEAIKDYSIIRIV